MVGCEDAGVDDSSPGDVEALVDGLGAEDSSGADLVRPFACLVEHEGEDVLVVGDGDSILVSCMIESTVAVSVHLHALKHKLTLAYHSSASSTVVSVLPTNAAVLLVNANNIGHLEGLALVVVEHCTQVLDRTKAVTSKFLNKIC
jgi:hypothetical protein